MLPAAKTGTMPSSSQRRIIGRNQVSLASEAAQELLTTAGWSAVAGSPSGSVIHCAAARRALPGPTPSAPIARATTRRDSGATPMGAPPDDPPAMVPAVCVPWPLSSYGVAPPPTKSRHATTLPARSGADGSTPVSMAPTRMPAPRTPKASHAAGTRVAARPQSPSPASGKGAEASGAASAMRTGASRSTAATAGSEATARISAGVPVKATALTSQNERTGPSTSSTTAGWLVCAVLLNARSSTSGRPS